MFVIRFPTQSAQFGVLLETYRKGGDIDHLAVCFFRIIVGDRQNNIFLKNADFNISAICFSYSFGTPDYPGRDCTPHPIIWAEYSAMNLATGSKDSFLLMSYFYI